MDNWDEVRTAYQVARHGTVSGAAEQLGVHHSTVIRHVDSLEGRLGVKLFQRHARGYTPTEAGEDLYRVAGATEDQLSQLHGRLKGRGDMVSGDLTITALPLVVQMLIPVMASFQERHPEVTLKFVPGERLLKLEYGEAHVAIRAGQLPPDQPDNVVQPFSRLQMGLFASSSYLAKHGPVADLKGHRFVGPVEAQARAPFHRWLQDNVPASAFIWRSDDMRAAELAVQAGIGIGFVALSRGRAAGLTEVVPHKSDWASTHWLVTHVDLHRSAKVQAFLSHLKDNAAALAGQYTPEL